MRQAKADELQSDAFTALMARLPEVELRKRFPVQFLDIDTFAEAEPSMGALVQLESGGYVGLIYAKLSETLKILLPEGMDPKTGIDALLEEVALPPSTVTWRCDRDRAPTRG